MKKYLSIYTLLALTCIVLQSCLFSEEEIFDESSANRATADVIKCQEILKDVPNGWKLEYYIGSNYSAGAVTLLMKFDGKQVEMASEAGAEGYKPGTIITSLYQVKSEQSTMLTFDSYNQLIHMFSGPLGLNMNVGGDYEFIIKEASAEKIVMQGKKYGNTIVMYALPDDLNWEAYINSVNKVEEDAFFNKYQLLVDGHLAGVMQQSYYTFVIAYNDENGNIAQKQEPFLFTTDGIRFREPVLLAGVTVQNFKWDSTIESFTCVDEGVKNVVVKGVYPEGYIKYDDYLGNYLLTCERYQNGKSESVELPISIVEDIADKSYKLKGLIGDLLLTYDKAEGTMAFKTQQVGLLSGYYLGCTTSNSAWGSFYPTYVSYQLGVMFGLVAVVQQAPFGFTFEDDGIFQQMSGKGKADNLIFLT